MYQRVQSDAVGLTAVGRGAGTEVRMTGGERPVDGGGLGGAECTGYMVAGRAPGWWRSLVCGVALSVGVALWGSAALAQCTNPTYQIETVACKIVVPE